MKKRVLPTTIVAISILPIVAALSVTEKASASEFQRKVVDPLPVCMLTERFDNVAASANRQSGPWRDYGENYHFVVARRQVANDKTHASRIQ